MAELLVAIAFFSMVSIVLTGAFVATFRSQREAFAFLNMQNNVRFALEVMNRTLRTGTQFSLPSASSIRFTDDQGRTVEYCLAAQAIRSQFGGAACDASSVALTAESVLIQNLSFLLTGAAPDDGIQPRITILVRIASEGISADTQVTVTQRELDS